MEIVGGRLWRGCVVWEGSGGLEDLVEDLEDLVFGGGVMAAGGYPSDRIEDGGLSGRSRPQ